MEKIAAISFCLTVLDSNRCEVFDQIPKIENVSWNKHIQGVYEFTYVHVELAVGSGWFKKEFVFSSEMLDQSLKRCSLVYNVIWILSLVSIY